MLAVLFLFLYLILSILWPVGYYTAGITHHSMLSMVFNIMLATGFVWLNRTFIRDLTAYLISHHGNLPKLGYTAAALSIVSTILNTVLVMALVGIFIAKVF